jgi:hypothetical protein
MTEASENRPKQWSLPVSIVATAVLIPLAFWLRFGYVDGYGYGVTLFLILLEVAVEVLPLRVDAAEKKPPPPVPRGRFDFLGVIWLLLIPFGPFLGWFFTSYFDVDAGNYRLLLSIKTVLCVIGPVVCVLPLLRYLRHPYVSFGLAVLAIGTGFPILMGIHAAGDLVRGPHWQDIQITGFRDIANNTQAGTRVRIAGAFVELADGRTLTRTQQIKLHKGAAHVLVLRGMARIIDVE